jgi:hypothetical protein
LLSFAEVLKAHWSPPLWLRAPIACSKQQVGITALLHDVFTYRLHDDVLGIIEVHTVV